MSMIKLLGLRISVYTRIARLALEEKDVDYQLEEVDIFADAGPPDEYLAHNPFGTIPCLMHGDYQPLYRRDIPRQRIAAVKIGATRSHEPGHQHT
jgi:glutathione S-transferase